MISKKCTACEVDYFVPPYRARQTKYCSQACRRLRLTKSCTHCGKSITRTASGFQGSHSYCSRTCQNASQHPLAMQAKRSGARARRALFRVAQPADHLLISLGNKQYARVDIEDFDWVSEFIWRMNDRGYAIRDGQPRRMHRAIVEKALARKLTSSEQVDHIDGDRLNNRRANLRLATIAENGRNKKPSVGTSMYKGVFWLKTRQRWVADIHDGGTKIRVGSFADEEAAALAYDAAAIQIFGDYAWLNFIGR